MKRLIFGLVLSMSLPACDSNSPERTESLEFATANEEAPVPQAMPEMADSVAGKAMPRSKRPKRKKKPMGIDIIRGDSPSPSSPSKMREAPEGAPAEAFKDHGVNAWTNPAEDKLSTFSIDVDTGSYTIARRKLNEGTLPPQAAVRVEEFVNYFKYDYPDPEETFAVYLEAAPSPFSSSGDRYLARVGVQGKRLASKNRKPIHLTFLVDVSGSMNQADKLPLAVKALKILTNNLKPKDTVSIVTYAGRTAKILDPTGASNRGAIFAALDGLGAGGGTGMEDGMKTAYEIAIRQKKSGGVSRVIVLSDGDANIGRASHDDILKQIKDYVDEGVTMSTIGLGMGNYKDTMMEQLSNKGNGNYYYIDSIAEARKVFGDQLDGTLQVIAKDVKIQVEFNPDKVKRYRLIGYENRDIADADFRNDKVDAGELGAGHTVTALYELELKGAPEEKLATVRVRHKTPEAFKAVENEFPLNAVHFRKKIQEASSDFQFVASVAAFAEILRGSPHVKDVSYAWVLEIAKASSAPSQADRQEFLKMVKTAQSLKQ